MQHSKPEHETLVALKELLSHAVPSCPSSDQIEVALNEAANDPKYHGSSVPYPRLTTNHQGHSLGQKSAGRFLEDMVVGIALWLFAGEQLASSCEDFAVTIYLCAVWCQTRIKIYAVFIKHCHGLFRLFFKQLHTEVQMFGIICLVQKNRETCLFWTFRGFLSQSVNRAARQCCF